MNSSRLPDENGDPRTRGKYVRHVPASPGTLTLVGVVHDHPASIHRVRHVVGESAPDTLLLELPPVAIPLFERYARSEREPPAFGGEMSAAIQAAGSATTVGIDRPTGGFLARLCWRLLRERPPLRTVRRVLSMVASATAHAVTCRLAATLAARTGVRAEVDLPVAHDVDHSDPPETQARDEQQQVGRARALTNAFRTSAASQLLNDLREEFMAARLAEYSDSDGDVVAVVGVDHLDPLAELLAARHDRPA